MNEMIPVELNARTSTVGSASLPTPQTYHGSRQPTITRTEPTIASRRPVPSGRRCITGGYSCAEYTSGRRTPTKRRFR